MSPDSVEGRLIRLEREQATVAQRMTSLEEMHRALAPLVREIATLTANLDHVGSGVHDLHSDVEKIYELIDRRTGRDGLVSSWRWWAVFALMVVIGAAGIIVQIVLAAGHA